MFYQRLSENPHFGDWTTIFCVHVETFVWVSSYGWQTLSVFWKKHDLHRLPNISYLLMHLPIYAFFKFLPTCLAQRTNFLMCNFLESFFKIGVRFATCHFVGAKADKSDKSPTTQYLTVPCCILWNSQENLLHQLNKNEIRDWTDITHAL